ncbi:hypothetical protein A7A76_14875 [Lysobacter enzymogenes]|uniref:hypothetical protein n=1 Tax=Lysobacter enzymogenes TaxID=69 RepID=UPI0019D31548|nr:hypothetical protein [Lysobacter enzymogenes]MBN7136000.1 hypothetical protein [Lysobacter enzymogenes]
MDVMRSVWVLSVAALAAVPGVGRSAEALPTYNYDMHCRAVSGGDFDKNFKCGEAEAAAYAKLQDMWASVAEKRKVECHNVAYDPETGKGSYARHLQCIEKGRGK